MTQISNHTCRLCNGVTKFRFQKTVLQRYPVSFFECEVCESLMAEEPYWLDEAYAIPGVHIDVSILGRSLKNWVATNALLRVLDPSRSWVCLDYGCETGVFVRLMRDLGHNFFGYDRYADAHFCDAFCADTDKYKYDLLSSFEVFEHFSNPQVELKSLLDLDVKVVVFSTWFYEKNHDVDWGYLAPECGQHVFFYSVKAMKLFASQLGYEFVHCRYFSILFKPNLLKPSEIQALHHFVENSQRIVSEGLASALEQVMFGNEFMNADSERAMTLLKNLLARSGGLAE
jgi:hypothetical protein